jgi:NADH:quinone reductase (non-electrogenic)
MNAARMTLAHPVRVTKRPRAVNSLMRVERGRRTQAAKIGGHQAMSPQGEHDHARPRVLVLGGGFAGIGAARALKKADADVVLIDKHDYHTFQPMLYQLASAAVEREAVGHPLRDLFHEQPNARVHQATVEGVDVAKREVKFAEMEPLSYDYLVLALGARVNFFGTEGAAEHAFPMYTLVDAVRLKEHVVRKW